jgi:hypothetical protein
METLHIYRKIIRNGIEIKIGKKKYYVRYPSCVWNKLPSSLHRVFADSLTYVATWHLSLSQGATVAYHFPHPPIEPSFFKILFYSIPMNVFEYKNTTTSGLIKQFYNANFQTQFKGLHYHYSVKKARNNLKDRAILLFSFGKDSLLTYALLQELGVKTLPIFMKEPQSGFENAHKKKLADRFYEKFAVEVDFFPLTVGRLRQNTGLYWGWDIILSQYAFILIPYYFYTQSKYLFFGNEQSCNFYTQDDEGYLVNPVFEQGVSAMQLLQDVPKLFSVKTHIGSLIEPLHDLMVLYVLHNRYPDIGRFQMSCFSEEPQAKKRRWCGHCEKCARLYVMLKALSISPDRVGFYNNEMLSVKKAKYYPLFNHHSVDSAFGASGLGREEQLLSFYLAYKNGVRGSLMTRFKNTYLHEAERKKEKLVKEYFSIHSSFSLPPGLRRRTIRIFQKEREKALNYVRRLL